MQEEKRVKEISEDSEELEKISQILNWKYKYQEMTNIQSKMSVTKIKELKNQEKLELEPIETKPKFMEEKIKLSSAEKGTLVHLILQKLDFTRKYTKQEIQEFIEKVFEKQIINQMQKEIVSSEQIYKIVNSTFFEKNTNSKTNI